MLKLAWAKHTHRPFDQVAHIGCQARYRPWARGEGMVCEFGADGQSYAIMADLIIEMLDNGIKKVQASWVDASL